ncbi:MAG: hypothetical protein AB8H79_06650 [Myxococcota bacterium]
METALFDISMTYGIAALLLLVGVVGIAALPWRSVQVNATAAAWADLSTLSGGFARTRVLAVRRTLTRIGQVASRRPATLTRTLS